MRLRLRHASLAVRIVVPVALIFVLSVALLLTYVWRVASRQTVESSVLSARATVTQFKALRAYYTERVVNKVKTAGRMQVSFNHDGRADAIPLPATMIHDLSEILGRDASGARIRLYSRYPFPNRANRQLDAFAQAALDEFQKNPDAEYVRAEQVDGRAVVRVAVADKMAVQACVTCHNSDPASPKRDWKLNDVRGALEVIVPIDRQMATARTMLASIAGLAGVGLLGVTALLVSFTRRSIATPIRRLVAALRSGAHEVTSASALVASSAQSLAHGASEQAASLEETSASMEEMASMTRQNAEHAHAAASVMAETERLVQGTDAALTDMVSSMTAINESADKVGRIIKTIDEIAFQTNILALNAAVEAARAGQAGLGFAVVADEVRALAERSAQAARDTAALIQESIARSTDGQGKVAEVTAAIRGITASSTKVKRLVDEMATASQQQAQGIEQVSQAVTQMERVTQTTAATAQQGAAASEELSAQAETSLSLVGQLARLVTGTGAAARDESADLAAATAAGASIRADATATH